MGYIEEQIRELREIAEMYEGMDGGEILKESADTIESLYKKLKERSNNGWIPCSERLPDKSGSYLVTTYSNGISQYISDIDQFIYNGMPDGYWINGKSVIAWQPLPNPYHG